MQHELFYLVWRQSGEVPTYKHPTPDSAKREAERLARLNPGCKFHVLACIGSVRVNDLAWTELSVDRIPF